LKDSNCTNCTNDSDPFLEHYKALIASRKSIDPETLRNSLIQNLKIAINNLPVKTGEDIEDKKVDEDDKDGTVSKEDEDDNWSFGKVSSDGSEDSDDSDNETHIGNMGFIKEDSVEDTKEGTTAEKINYFDEIFKENFITSVPVFSNLDELGIAIKNYEDKTDNQLMVH
jgi:hypothetical protein